VTFRMPASGLGRNLLLVVGLVFLGSAFAGAFGVTREDPGAGVLLFAVMSLSSGFILLLYRAMGRGQVTVDGQGLMVEMRPLAKAFIPLETIVSASRFTRPTLGFGLNLGVHVGIGLGGSLDMVVGLGPGAELSLSRPCSARVLGVPLGVKKVRMSLDEADFFVGYVNSMMEKRR